jgi:NAD(P)H-flavin reductase
MAVASAGSAAVADAARADPLVAALYRVTRTQRELADTVTLELAPLAGPCATFAPGQFNMLYAFGVGEIAISVSGNPSDTARLIHTIREVGAVSRAIAGLGVGDVLGVRGPYGVGWPVEEAEGSDVVLVAGGLGLAPLRPAIYHLLEHRARYGRLSILFGARNPEQMLFLEEIEQWRQRLDIDIHVTVDHADSGWHGNVGVVPMLVPRVALDPAKTVALVCGPEVMMRFTVNALHSAGLAGDRIHVSMERNMKCGIGLCGHCQFGPTFVCKDGPVMRYDRIAEIFAMREI